MKTNLLVGTALLLASSSTFAAPETPDVTAAPVTKQSIPLNELRIFAEVLEGIKTSYVDEVGDSTLINNAIKGMLYQLDPHSAYLEPKDFEDLQVSTSGEFGGLGIEIGMKDGYVEVITPLDDTPADVAGILPGDLIMQLNDQPVQGMSLSESIEIMRGPVGSDIDLLILRQGETEPLEFTITRDKIQITSARSKTLESGIGYLRISQFQSDTAQEALKQIQKLQEEAPLKGLILDLRNNPGGVLGAAVDMSDLFLTEGNIVHTKGRNDEAGFSYDATPEEEIMGLPIMVLVNGGSASAAEIVAGALQDHHRALIAGTRTFGKGSVQSVIPLYNDHALKLTTSRYYTPSGRTIQAKGIEPDILIEPAKLEIIENYFAGYREADLRGHLENEDTPEQETTNPEQSNSKKISSTDYQLYEAIRILKGIILSESYNAISAIQ